MSSRIELHEILCEILGSRNVYFEPPETLKMKYPCIVYERSNIDVIYADNKSYTNNTRYSIILMDANPDSQTIYKLLELPGIRFDRHFSTNNLNHDVFELYFKK